MTHRDRRSVCFAAIVLLAAPLACGGDAFAPAPGAQAGAAGQGSAGTAGNTSQGGSSPLAGSGGSAAGTAGEGGSHAAGQGGGGTENPGAGAAGAENPGGAGQGGGPGTAGAAGDGTSGQGGETTAGVGGEAGGAGEDPGASGAAGDGGEAGQSGEGGAGGEAGAGGDAGQGGEAGTSGQGGDAGQGSEAGASGQGGASSGGAAQGGGGQGGSGPGGAGGSGGASCGPCPLGQGCGYGGEPGKCGGKVRVKSGYVLGDGSKALGQSCDTLKDGSLDCTPSTHPFQVTPLPPTGVTLEKGVTITTRFLVSYFVGEQQKIRSGYLESGGQREWVQLCDLAPGAKVDCEATTHPFQERKLPPPGLALPAGVAVSGRFQFLYEKNGKRLLRDGYLQSDGTKSHSQTCDVADDGTLDCSPDTHPFQSFAMPPSGVTLPDGQGIRSRTSYLYLFDGEQVLRNSFLRSDGLVNYVQTCTVGWDGAFACPTGPLVEEKVPVLPTEPGQKVGAHYAFTFVE